MAKALTSKPKKSKSKVLPALDPAVPYDPNKDRRALEALIARHGEPSPAVRAAFDELCTDAQRAALGVRSRAAGVFRDGVSWAVVVSQTFTDLPAALTGHYAMERFQYFLWSLRQLDGTLQAQQVQQGGLGAARGTAAEREQEARAARAALSAKLTGFAGAREVERGALAAALGNTADANALGSSLRALVKLGQEWLARPEPNAKIQCQAAGLTEAVVQAALAAAEGLTGAATAATLTGKKVSTDAPAVNVAEGMVLHEMAEVLRCFREARRATQLVPALVPGPATHHVLGTKKGSKDEPGSEPILRDDDPEPS
jgi:hypothetical protein